MVPTPVERINSGHLVKTGAFVIFLALASLATGVPTRAQEVAPPSDATAVLERALAFARAHPRMRGRFDHVYRDRARTTELRSTGRFAIEAPRIGITMDGEDAHTVAIDETTARVLVPREGEAPLLLAFRIDTTPLPTILGVLAGTTPASDAFTVRAIELDADDDVIELRPTDAGSQIDRIWLDVWPTGAIARVLVVDWRGATHRVVVTELTYPSRLPASALAPTFPADAVVVEP
jgi:hypothetical protein